MDEQRIRHVEEIFRRAAEAVGGTGEAAEFRLPSGWYLPGRGTKGYRQDLRESYGFDDLFMRLEENEFGVVNPTDPRPFARSRIERSQSRRNIKHLDRLSFMLANFQLDEARGYLPGRNMYSLDHLKVLQQQALSGLDVKGTQMVFDVETAGLTNRSGLRQVSARMVDASGNIVGEGINFHLDNKMMNLGLSEFMEHKFSGVTPLNDTQAEQELKRFFKLASQQDFLTGQNVSFDINQLVAAAKRTSTYGTDAEFQEYVDAFIGKAKGGKVIDTQAHARIMLGRIGLAPELRRAKKFTEFSLENIILQTSLVSDIVAEGGHKNFGSLEEAEAFLSKGLHDSDVDVVMTNHLRRMLGRAYNKERALRLKPDRVIKGNTFLTNTDLRAKISGEASIVPTAKYSVDEFEKILRAAGDDIPPEVLARMHAVAGQSGRISALEASMIRNQNLAMEIGETNAIDYGRNRNMLGFGDDVRSLADLAAIPTSGEWREAQQQAAKAGLPFAGLSFQERAMTEALTRATGGRDLTSRFNLATKARIISEGKLAALPLEALEGFGNVNTDIATGKQLLDYSLFSHFDRPTETGARAPLRGVGVYLRDGLETEGLIRHLQALPAETLSKFGIDEEYLAALRPILDEGRGVQIASTTASWSDAGMQTLHQVFEDVMGSTVDEDVTNPMFRVAGMGTEDGVLRTGPVMYTRGLEGDAGIAEAIGRLSETSNLAAGEPVDVPGTGWGKIWGDRILSATQKHVNPHINWRSAGVAGVAAGAAYLFYKDHERRNASYNDVLAPQPYEEASYYQDYKKDLGESYRPEFNGSRNRSPHHLSTAGVVGQLDRNKIGHTGMDTRRKNSHLYGGNL